MVRFLNKNIEYLVLQDDTLYLAWCLVGPTYGEIDPLHNPDWVKRTKEWESSFYDELKIKIADIFSEKR